jgi:hypothetical protein
MRLSEAIRLGAMLGPQTRGPRGLCALNSALAAVGKSVDEIGGLSCTTAAKFWPWANKTRATCPACGESGDADWIIAMHLNDDHRWTREQIADWVATVEPREESPAATEGSHRSAAEVPHA